jgi:hypothetical protein
VQQDFVRVGLLDQFVVGLFEFVVEADLLFEFDVQFVLADAEVFHLLLLLFVAGF